MNMSIIDDPFIEKEVRLRVMQEYLTESPKPSNDKTAISQIDLHLHTNYSDGYWTPTGLDLEAYRKGMKLIALTDHDGFVEIEELFSALQAIKKATGVEIGFVPGIEFSTNYYYEADKKKEVHILGYFPSATFAEFEDYLKKLDNRTKAYIDAFQKNRIL